jgi:TPR repeat protein
MVICREVYEKGGQDLNPNYQKAFEYYYEACNFGIPEAYTHLGNMYRFVTMG